jgi:hypothetical protein
MLGGAFLGGVAAMILSRIRYGWGDAGDATFRLGVREAALVSIPAAALAGILVGFVVWWLRWPRRLAGG